MPNWNNIRNVVNLLEDKKSPFIFNMEINYKPKVPCGCILGAHLHLSKINTTEGRDVEFLADSFNITEDEAFYIYAGNWLDKNREDITKEDAITFLTEWLNTGILPGYWKDLPK